MSKYIIVKTRDSKVPKAVVKKECVKKVLETGKITCEDCYCESSSCDRCEFWENNEIEMCERRIKKFIPFENYNKHDVEDEIYEWLVCKGLIDDSIVQRDRRC